jgi:hypothetical protein
MVVGVHPEMALFVLIGVLRGFPATAYRRTPRRKPLCGLYKNKNCSFLNCTPIVFILNCWIDTIQAFEIADKALWSEA